MAGTGAGDGRRYRLLPVMPGIFEMVLISESPATMSDWHRRFAELIEALFETGYHLDYLDKQTPALARFLPVGAAIAGHPMALPTDRLEVILDRYEVFGVSNCQCRMTSAVKGEACGGPVEVCMSMGSAARRGIEIGIAREISKHQALEIKHEAESHGLVNWILNLEKHPVAGVLFLLRLLLQGDAVGQRIQRPGAACPAPFHAPFRHGGLCALRTLRDGLPDGRNHRRHGRKKRLSTTRRDASAAGCASCPAKSSVR